MSLIMSCVLILKLDSFRHICAYEYIVILQFSLSWGMYYFLILATDFTYDGMFLCNYVLVLNRTLLTIVLCVCDTKTKPTHRFILSIAQLWNDFSVSDLLTSYPSLCCFSKSDTAFLTRNTADTVFVPRPYRLRSSSERISTCWTPHRPLQRKSAFFDVQSPSVYYDSCEAWHHVIFILLYTQLNTCIQSWLFSHILTITRDVHIF